MENESLLGVIIPTELYTLKAFKRRLGIQDATLRSARRKGLRVTYVHKQGFVLGGDWIEYVLGSPLATKKADRFPNAESNAIG